MASVMFVGIRVRLNSGREFWVTDLDAWKASLPAIFVARRRREAVAAPRHVDWLLLRPANAGQRALNGAAGLLRAPVGPAHLLNERPQARAHLGIRGRARQSRLLMRQCWRSGMLLPRARDGGG